MATSVHRQAISISNTITEKVVLYPSRALITRKLSDIELKPGANEVEIYGLTPTVDQHSIKVDGIGTASVTDMTVDLVPNRQSFEEVYEDDLEVEMSDPEEGSDDEEQEGSTMKTIRDELTALQDKVDAEQANHKAISHRQSYLKQWWSAIETKGADASKLQSYLDAYQEQSVKLAKEAAASTKRGDGLTKQRDRQDRKLKNATRETRFAERKQAVEKAKQETKKQMKNDAVRKEKQRIKDERAKYWPKKVYKVTLHLDVPTETPGSSRRSSVSSVTLAKDPGPEIAEGCEDGSPRKLSLMLSYITLCASWAPRYDIEFSTGRKNGKIIYRAEFNNHTSDTWEQAKISLSTSQASFQGLNDEVPWLQPWRVGLSKTPTTGALRSHQEQNARSQALPTAQDPSQANRHELFGIDGPWSNKMQQMLQHQRGHHQQPEMARAAAYTTTNARMPSESQAPHAASQFGSHQPMQVRTMQTAPPAAPGPRGPRSGTHGFGSTHANDCMSSEDLAFGDAPQPRLDFEESTWEDHGLTTTYDIPGTRTLEPSSLTRRHKIASLPFNNLILTSIAVPKLRAAAFLRARFRNPSSSVTLLKGTAGLTLDGTFLGNTTLPRVSPGELITLPLGVDPAVHLSYAKPSVKRSTQGIFTKDQSHQFSRSVIITNTKSSPAELLVVDQVPISEDERLRVELIEPRGLYKDGDTVSCGISAHEDKKTGNKGKWGSASATMKKNGEVCFRVNLEKGGACRLPLEFEAKAPSNEGIASK